MEGQKSPREPFKRPVISDFQELMVLYWQQGKPAAEARGLLYEAANRHRWRIVHDMLLPERIGFLAEVASESPVWEFDETLRLTARQQIARKIIPDLRGKSLAGEGGWDRRDANDPQFQATRDASGLLVAFFAQSPSHVAGLSKSELSGIHAMLELLWISQQDGGDCPRLVSEALANTFAFELIREHHVIGALGHLVKLLNGRQAIKLYGDELYKQAPDNIETILDECGQFLKWDPIVGPVQAHDIVETITYLLPVLRYRYLEYCALSAQRA